MSIDLAAEKTLALSLASNPDAWDYCQSLEPRMFVDEQAQRIFSAVQGLVISGRPVTPVTVQAEIVKTGKGGSMMPAWTRGATARIEEIPALSARVRECWARRSLKALGARLAEVTDQAGSGAMLAEMAEAQEALSRGQGKAKSMLQLSADRLAEAQRDMERPSASRLVFDTGLKALDAYMGGLRPGVLAVFAARPGQGKSSLVMAIASSLAATNVPVGLFWLEDDWRDALARYHAARHGVAASDLRGSARRVAEVLNENAMRNADEQSRIYVDDTHGLKITDIAARMRRMSREYGVRVFIADHLGEIGIERDDRWGDRHDLALGKAARIFRDTAKNLDAAPILVSQMNRRIEQRGQDSSPKMSDLDGSGQLEQAARFIGFVSRPKDKPSEMWIDIAKNTIGGDTGTVRLSWNGPRMTVEG